MMVETLAVLLFKATAAGFIFGLSSVDLAVNGTEAIDFLGLVAESGRTCFADFTGCVDFAAGAATFGDFFLTDGGISSLETFCGAIVAFTGKAFCEETLVVVSFVVAAFDTLSSFDTLSLGVLAFFAASGLSGFEADGFVGFKEATTWEAGLGASSFAGDFCFALGAFMALDSGLRSGAFATFRAKFGFFVFGLVAKAKLLEVEPLPIGRGEKARSGGAVYSLMSLKYAYARFVFLVFFINCLAKVE